MNTVTAESGPEALTTLLAQAYADNAHLGETRANIAAYRAAGHSGWYKTADGWKQIGPNVRDKVNVRQAVQQGDGTFAVYDVDVFYPNAVKGVDAIYDADEIGQLQYNTNHAVQQGGQPPALTIEHPHPDRKRWGVPTKAFGKCINFRASPRGESWTRCDLVDVDPTVVDDWKKGRYIGLSAGFGVQDAGGLNRRFAHVALLGADMQALSALPRTEVFDANFSAVFFSTDSSAFEKGSIMPADRKALFAAMKTAGTKLAAAFASCEAGEPDAAKKLQDAQTEFDSARATYDKEFAAVGVSPITVAQQPTDEDDLADLTLEPGSRVDLPPGIGCGGGNDEYAALEMQMQLDEMKSQFTAEQTKSANLEKIVKAMTGKVKLQEFDAFIAKMQADGHMFDAESARASFIESPEAEKVLRIMIEKSPINPLHGKNPTFAADDANKNVEPASTASLGKPTESQKKDILALLRKNLPQMNFSAEELEIGFIGGNGK